MAGLCEGGNEPPGSLKASKQSYTLAVSKLQEDTGTVMLPRLSGQCEGRAPEWDGECQKGMEIARRKRCVPEGKEESQKGMKNAKKE
ncbi:hypothetical protein ANN_24090 [Periplaneta americana]|uniref:Uncharacterized protein n=1 Tax=Periplaneta americana TaxID=6978 RepID=A0ABQ8S2M5_PERAM|nr:hypothetical protein ANN_24090 [Periplaneta americana]